MPRFVSNISVSLTKLRFISDFLLVHTKPTSDIYVCLHKAKICFTQF